MRLLIVGSNQIWSIERIYFQYLNELNPDTKLFAIQNILHEYLNKSKFNKVIFRLGISSIIKTANCELLNVVEEFKPEVLWIFKGMEILPDTLKLLKQKKINLVNYNPDHPFIRSSRGSWNKNVFNSVGLYNLHFCYNKLLIKKIISEYKIPAEYLPFGYELDQCTFERIKNFKELNKVCFLGNPDKIRASVINYLLKQGMQVDVYGNNWHKFFPKNKNTALNIYGAIYGENFWTVIRSYRVQLNIFRAHNFGSHNMRTFEIPAAGGLQIAPESDEHREFFEDGKEIFLYKNNNELLEITKILINSSNHRANSFRIYARNRVLRDNYSYKDRSSFVYDVLNKF